jgi:hypothetical protein
MWCVRFLLFTVATILVTGQGDHRRRPADRDEDDASFKVQYNTTYYGNYSEGDIRYYVSLNVRRRNGVLDRLNVSADVPPDTVNPLFVQPADDAADFGSGLVVPPSDATAPAAANGTIKAGASPAWFGWLGTVPVVGEYRKICLVHSIILFKRLR